MKELQEAARQVLDEAGLAAKEDRIWPQAIELGWLQVPVPESLGGLDQGFAGACAIQLELGRGLATASCTSALLAMEAIAHSSIPDRAALIERVAAGDYIAVPLSGEAKAVPSADRATHILRITDTVVSLVPRPETKLVARETWDETRRLFDVEFAGAGLVLASGATAQVLGRRIFAARDFLLAADSIGGAEALLEKTVDYLQTRRQFGRPLALFQALKHRCADLKVLVSAAEALLLDALDRAGDRLDSEEAEASGKAAKLLACSAYAKVAEEALQLHGGIGMTAEHHCHLFLKRALLNAHLGRRSESYALDLADRLLKSSAVD